MGLQTGHPELPSEQAYVDRAYACVQVMLRDAGAAQFQGGDIFEREAFERWKSTRVGALSDTRSALVFGRIDRTDDETYYVGRHHVRDDGYDTVVVDWRAPVAQAFYRASARDPMGLDRRRQFLVDGRLLLGIADDHLERDDGLRDGALRGDEILQAELRRRRTGDMRDIVATIQAEQDAIIRAPLGDVVVVQGGPGTGKTAIGLHRAAYLLYTHRERLEQRGVLVVGPNPVFIGYVSQVLPSLGEWAVSQIPVDGLSAFRSTAEHDRPDVARIKGDARMGLVLRRALESRWGSGGEDVAFELEGVRFALIVGEIDAEATRIRERRPAWRDGRELVREHLVTAAWRAYEDAAAGRLHAANPRLVASVVRRTPAFRKAMDRVWPSVKPETLVADMLRDPAGPADGILTLDEQRLLARRSRRFTRDDLPLLDEAKTLIDGAPERYGHVVVDEAQDLSPMQVRMIARRSPGGSMTVLGDLAQATGVWAHDDWSEVAEHLPAAARLEELTLGYRVSGAIMALAGMVLRHAAPALRAPAAVRADEGEVTVHRVTSGRRAGLVAEQASVLAGRYGSTAVIVPDSISGEVRAALAGAAVDFGDAETDGLERPVTLVRVAQCKGLEFDAVVLVEPSYIVDEGGLRLLFVAVTRAMRGLAVVHAGELPPALRGSGPLSA